MDERRRKQSEARDMMERFLLYIGRSGLFLFGYFVVSKYLVNNLLSRFTSTGWEFTWEMFGYIQKH